MRRREGSVGDVAGEEGGEGDRLERGARSKKRGDLRVQPRDAGDAGEHDAGEVRVRGVGVDVEGDAGESELAKLGEVCGG